MIFYSFYNIFLFFNKKILVLLFFELLMISFIYLYFFFSFSSFFTFSISFFFMVFMVIDSVFGISLFIDSSRNSSSLSMAVSSI